MSDLLPTLDTFHCFACSPTHPKGLHLRFRSDGTDRVRSDFALGGDYVGLGSVVHGGIVATVFDEAMAWVLYRHRYAPHLTATMEIRFRGTIAADTPLVVTAWIEEDRGSRVRVASALAPATEPDRVLAQASGLYVRAPESVMGDVPDAQRRELQGVFEEFRVSDAS
ncbi:MAG TPA: PaaI family thioesterase [Acidimicrobiia bacterium]|nr:PaaI family thioesterase [Acidimicrobiia bacterium]